ncbi:peptidyl-prolyl cis-trans isomerase SurA [Wenyingzhuangia heitensis]|uniref:Peptidyl-prolyl cis-trans isomerase SurA n=1 Tax=Wenyingzhuangia heitensis TaxID=1487859 RepID=A0ABX0UCZ0_9FLAO|nr:peptidylprolyl isomerase [Wenyingzhuangia heitensis]NIJ45740.1 peptidyl-prolyl cis-trans isomerase SurA [Wenyingzhuangia heitensis]
MKKYILGILILGSQLVTIAQKKEKTLFKIDKVPTYVSEFEKLFSRNNATIGASDFEQNLQLMVDYKLKLRQAKLEGIDTLTSLQKELKKYKADLASPFFTDDETLKDLLNEAYSRSLHQVKASHILIMTKDNDTIEAFNKINKIKKELDKGADFEKLAVQYSEDKSVEKNKGDLGYFSVFRMVYPFENAAYSTPVGQVSKIIKTRFGYHLLKIYDKSKIDGKLKVAHVMVAGLEEDKKQKIDSIYKQLKAGEKFEILTKKYSDDKRSANNGGELKPFTKGSLPPSFEEVAFSLTIPNSYSEPFATPYGWHIVKYIGNEPMPSFEEAKEGLKKKILNDDRGTKPKEVAFNKLKEKHHITIDKQALKVFENDKVYQISADSLQKVLIRFKDEEIKQSDFANYIKSRRASNPSVYFDKFKTEKTKEYVVDHLEEENDKFKETISTYRNGLVIFELMKTHVWDVPVKQPEKVEDFYQENFENYKEKGDKFEEVKGYVESDYQDKIQKEWLAELRANSKIKFSRRQVKKLKKAYQNE